MSVLAVIPCLNEEAHLPGLLAQMLADPAIDMLVVADGGSTDRGRAIVEDAAERDPRVQLLDNPARIQSAGVNAAVSQWGHEFDWLLRIDAHCRYPDRYASRLLVAQRQQDSQSVVVPMITNAGSGFQLAVATAQNSVFGTGGSAHRHLSRGQFVEHGHHALMDLTLYRQVGGYCEAMRANEDAELDHRLGAAGARIWLEPDAAIDYFPRSGPVALWRQYYRYGAGRARNVIRHRMRPRLRQLFPLAVPIAILGLPLALVYWIFAVPAITWLLTCLVIGSLVGIREGGGWALLSGVAAAIMHLSWGLGFIAEALSHPCGVPERSRAKEMSIG